jgi:hypothetical protein
MDKEEILKSTSEKIDRARAVEGMIVGTGWKIYREIVDERIKELSNIKNIDTLKELEAIKKAVRILEEVEEELLAIVQDASSAQEIKEQFEKVE